MIFSSMHHASNLHKLADANLRHVRLLNEADQTVAAYVFGTERKVRAPQSRMPVNDRTP